MFMLLYFVHTTITNITILQYELDIISLVRTLLEVGWGAAPNFRHISWVLGLSV